MLGLANRHALLLFLIAVSLVPTRSALAEEAASARQEEAEVFVDEVVITEQRLPTAGEDIRAVPSKVTVITAEDIRRSGAKTVQEALMQSTGIIMYNAVGNNFEQTIDLRGFNAQPVPGTTVFVDGVRLNQPDFNQINFDLIPLESIERIEILPGSSAIYGKNALGGVINIITKSGTEQRQATADVAFGSYGRQLYNANTGGPLGKFNYYANFSRELEDGYRDQSSARISRFVGKAGFRPSKATDLAVTYTYVKDRLEQAGSLPLSLAEQTPRANFTPGDFADREDNFVRFNGSQGLPLGFSVTANAFYRRLQQELFTVGQPFLVGGTNTVSRNLTDVESWGGVLQFGHEAAPFGMDNKLVLGGEFTRNDFGGSLLSVSDFGPFRSRSTTDEEIVAAYVQDTLNITSHLLLTGGLRYDRDELDFVDAIDPTKNARKVFDRVTPRAGITYLLAPRTSAYFSYSQGFRVPTNDELFASPPTSNPNLQAVRTNSFELGIKSNIQPWIDVAAALFLIDGSDEIFFVCDVCTGTDGENRNIDKTRRRGVEASLKARPNQFVDAAVNYTFTEAQFKTNFNASATEVVTNGNTLPLVPKNRLSVIGAVHPTKEWTVSLSGLYVSTQFLQNDLANRGPRLQGYFVLNGQVTYDRSVPGGRLRAFFMINNMLDNKYFTQGIFASNNITGGGLREAFVVPAPTITFYGGLSYRFESFPR